MKLCEGEIPVALTIGGSDSGGGAGIQSDLKTFAAVGVYGTSAITSVTVQNTLGVMDIWDVDVSIIRRQIKAVAEDIGVDAAKTGMLHTTEIIEAVVEEISLWGFPTVVDPLMKPKGGASLMTPGALVTFKEKLIPLAKVVTPNRQEAERLSGVKVRTLKDAEEAAEEISRLGVEAVVIKGGHIDTPGESVDLLYEDSQVKTYRLPRLDSKLTHGAGCSFSAAITGLLAKGFDIKEAVERAKRIVFDAIRHGFDVGKGYGSVNPLAELHLKSEKYAVIMALEEALEKLNTRDEFFELMPEVRMNFVYALPRAIDIKEVAGFPGRITFDGKQLASVSRPRFGVSTHVAKTIITVMKSFPDIRSALNIKYERDLVDASVKLGLNVLNYDRRLEPEEIRRTEGASIPWGVEQVLKELDLRPDIIFHLGDIGKEPMITVLAETPLEVVKKVLKVMKNR